MDLGVSSLTVRRTGILMVQLDAHQLGAFCAPHSAHHSLRLACSQQSHPRDGYLAVLRSPHKPYRHAPFSLSSALWGGPAPEERAASRPAPFLWQWFHGDQTAGTPRPHATAARAQGGASGRGSQCLASRVQCRPNLCSWSFVGCTNALLLCLLRCESRLRQLSCLRSGKGFVLCE